MVKFKRLRHWRLRGDHDTYAHAAYAYGTLRPLVGGVVLRLSDASANQRNEHRLRMRFAWNPPAARLMA